MLNILFSLLISLLLNATQAHSVSWHSFTSHSLPDCLRSNDEIATFWYILFWKVSVRKFQSFTEISKRWPVTVGNLPELPTEVIISLQLFASGELLECVQKFYLTIFINFDLNLYHKLNRKELQDIGSFWRWISVWRGEFGTNRILDFFETCTNRLTSKKEIWNTDSPS